MRAASAAVIRVYVLIDTDPVTVDVAVVPAAWRSGLREKERSVDGRQTREPGVERGDSAVKSRLIDAARDASDPFAVGVHRAPRVKKGRPNEDGAEHPYDRFGGEQH
jgi:hypothetical protein